MLALGARRGEGADEPRRLHQSFDSLDKLAADAVCHGLEAKGVRCWMAPRDQIAGKAYGQQITEAIRDAQVMVLVFSEHVNNSQAVLNEINLAAGANVTIVPFRIASVDVQPRAELLPRAARTGWTPSRSRSTPISTPWRRRCGAICRRMRTSPRGPPRPQAGPDVAAAAPLSPPSPPSPPTGPAAAPAGVAAHAPVRHNYTPVLIVGLVLAFVLAIVLIGVSTSPRPPVTRKPPSLTQAVANAIQEGAKDDRDKSDRDAGAQAVAAAGPQPPRGDGAELTPLGRPKPAFVRFYQTELLPGGPPEGLQGAMLINARELIESMRERDAGVKPFWLIDARGCTPAQTIPTAQCLPGNSIQELQAKAPNKAAQAGDLRPGRRQPGAVQTRLAGGRGRLHQRLLVPRRRQRLDRGGRADRGPQRRGRTIATPAAPGLRARADGLLVAETLPEFPLMAPRLQGELAADGVLTLSIWRNGEVGRLRLAPESGPVRARAEPPRICRAAGSTWLSPRPVLATKGLRPTDIWPSGTGGFIVEPRGADFVVAAGDDELEAGAALGMDVDDDRAGGQRLRRPLRPRARRRPTAAQPGHARRARGAVVGAQGRRRRLRRAGRGAGLLQSAAHLLPRRLLDAAAAGAAGARPRRGRDRAAGGRACSRTARRRAG